MDDTDILLGVIAFIAKAMGEDPGVTPSRDRRLCHVMISMALLSECCNHDANTIRLLVDEVLKQPSVFITLDSV